MTNSPHEEMRQLWRYVSESKLHLMRNFSFSAASVLLATILLISQIGHKDDALDISLLSASVGLPLWISLALIFEAYIFNGKRSYPHIRDAFSANIILLLMLASSTSLITTITSLIWHLSFVAVLCFGSSALVAFVLAGVHSDNLSKFLKREKSGESPEN